VHSPISTEVRSTEALSGGRGLTARRTGRWLRLALPYPHSTEASPLHMVLVGLIVSVFLLLLEARRYRYFNVWRARARLLETDFYAPMIRGEGVRLGADWAELLALCRHRLARNEGRGVASRLS
jgi:uncharacterized membrane protein